MRAVIQRVSRANVSIENEIRSSIGGGLLILLGVEEADDQEDINWLVKKILSLRIFGDEDGKMNLSISDIGGQIIVVSQFTLHASTKKGNRPSFIKAAAPDYAKQMYESFVESLRRKSSLNIQTGTFGAMMEISLVNNGPVTILMDTKNKE